MLHETSQLEDFDQIYSVEESAAKAQNQQTFDELDPSRTTTTEATTPEEATIKEYFNQDLVTEFDLYASAFKLN